jgi:hypothetical protein
MATRRDPGSKPPKQPATPGVQGRWGGAKEQTPNQLPYQPS